LIDQAANAGVRAQTGFALQRNMALYILLDEYDKNFKDGNYFVSLESHEDLLFCFLNDKNEAIHIASYQSKKKSSGSWTITAAFSKVLLKVLGVGIDLINDSIKKSSDYTHDLFFSSNATITLESNQTNKANTDSVIINEENCEIRFSELDADIRKTFEDKIIKKLTTELKDQINNLNLKFIEFNRTDKEQKNQLEGKLTETFGRKISDKRAALDTLISKFHSIELIYNQGSIPKLLDVRKRVSSQEIEATLKIITTKSKAFDYWRAKKTEISIKLRVRPFEKDDFEHLFELSFDLFKDLKQAEHIKILIFVKNNYKQCLGFTEEECVGEMFEEIKENQRPKFKDLELKAIIYAAYFEASHKMEY